MNPAEPEEQQKIINKYKAGSAVQAQFAHASIPYPG
jgi:hypothetical protein